VESIAEAKKTWQNTGEVIPEKNLLHVLFAANDLLRKLHLLGTAEFTVERSYTNVLSVTRHLFSLEIYTITSESTLETNHTSAHCVTEVSASPATCRHTNVKYTATGDLMTVVTVGRCLKVAIIWSVMFILTLMQSRTHVVTVQTVLHSLANSRHICWSHTMKVIGSLVTSVRRNSARVVTLRSICFVMKVWSCMFPVIVHRVSVQGLNWGLTRWDTLMSSCMAVVYVVGFSSAEEVSGLISIVVQMSTISDVWGA